VKLRDLLDDVRYQIEQATYPPDEIAARFHHRLVAIHPFPNGNGRHARMMADLLIQKLGQPRFTWGSKSLTEATNTRISYIASLRAADSGNIQPLLAFVRS
jgi:Fic-DOC domain mobile mystery protein B